MRENPLKIIAPGALKSLATAELQPTPTEPHGSGLKKKPNKPKNKKQKTRSKTKQKPNKQTITTIATTSFQPPCYNQEKFLLQPTELAASGLKKSRYTLELQAPVPDQDRPFLPSSPVKTNKGEMITWLRCVDYTRVIATTRFWAFYWRDYRGSKVPSLL